MVDKELETSVLSAFRRAAADMPWYRTLLNEHGVSVDQVRDLVSFSSFCPILSKQNTFDRFPPYQLAATTRIADVATLLTSSGHGGRFSFGLGTRREAGSGGRFMDDAFDAAFDIKSRSTLAINCLPMGVGFTSECMTVATTSVREDMALALVQAFGSCYDQILLASDPLFIKRLTDQADAEGTDWRRYRVNVALGEEIFGEHFRQYIATCLGLNIDTLGGGYIMSSFGVGELGLHLCYETTATIALRRAAWRNRRLADELLGTNASRPLPMILTFDPARTFVEIADPDPRGYGMLTISMLDTELPIPLLRYQPGDVAKLLDPASVAAVLERYGLDVPGTLSSNLLALEGRAREILPNGSHVGVYKDALYADHEVAKELTGAFRVAADCNTYTLHVQLRRPAPPPHWLERRLLGAIPEQVRPNNIVVYPYHQFPFGMSIDYERKFLYYLQEEQARPAKRELTGIDL
jgi:phenylacetate-CoA ligase